MRPSPNANSGRIRSAKYNADKAFGWATESTRLESGTEAGLGLRALRRSSGPKYEGEKYSGGGGRLAFEFVPVTRVVASDCACRFAWSLCGERCVAALTARRCW
jgi:hypothetical protein